MFSFHWVIESGKWTDFGFSRAWGLKGEKGGAERRAFSTPNLFNGLEKV